MKDVKITKRKGSFTISSEKPQFVEVTLKNGESFSFFIDEPIRVYKTSPIERIVKAESPTQLSRDSHLSEGEHDSPPKWYPEDRSQYAVPEFYLFPIDTEEHVRAALGYFSKHPWKPKEHKKRAAQRILRAAKKFGIKVSEDSDVYRTAKGDKAQKDIAVGTLGGISAPSL